MDAPKLHSLKVIPIPDRPSISSVQPNHDRQQNHQGRHPSYAQRHRLRRSQMLRVEDILPQGTGGQVNVVA